MTSLPVVIVPSPSLLNSPKQGEIVISLFVCIDDFCLDLASPIETLMFNALRDPRLLIYLGCWSTFKAPEDSNSNGCDSCFFTLPIAGSSISSSTFSLRIFMVLADLKFALPFPFSYFSTELLFSEMERDSSPSSLAASFEIWTALKSWFSTNSTLILVLSSFVFSLTRAS